MKKILPAFLISAAVLAVYATALRNGFVWDDTALILRDPLIRSWRLIPEGFQHFLFTDATASDFYRPIQRLTYTLDYGAFGFHPWAYHLTSLLCHLAAAISLLFVATELLRFFGVEERRRDHIAFFATLAWAIHPVHSAAVSYISGRADPLAAAFGFLGLYCGVRALRAAGAERWMLWIVTGALLLFSALSKETGLIFLLLWIAVLLLRRRWKEMVPAGVVVIFAIVTYLSLRLPAEHVPAPTLHTPPPLLVRPILAARALAEYAGLVLFPLNLHMDRDVETHPEGAGSAGPSAWRELQTLCGILLAAAAIFCLVRSRQRDPAVFYCLILAGIAYLPVSGIFLLNATVAEHWIYLPTAFLFLAAALTIARFLRSDSRPGDHSRLTIVRCILTVWLVFLGVRTFLRNFDWKDQRIFVERTIANGGDSARMLINLAGVELKEGHLAAAKKDLALALRKEPTQPMATLNLAAVAIRQNDFAVGRDLLNQAMKMPPVEAQAHELLAVLEYKENGRVDLLRLRLASRTGPPNWAIEKRYVMALAENGTTSAAIAELRASLATQWFRAGSWQVLSELLATAGATREALEAREKAKRYDVHLDEHPDVP